MLIEQLELENFKSYAHAIIPLAPGTNAIVGANGAGKSSLLEALGFALFNVKPDGFTLANLLREGSTKEGRIVVTLYSSADERRYEVERIFTDRTTRRYRVYDLELGRAIVAEGEEQVLGWMRYHLRMEPSANLGQFFENTIGVPQGTFTAPFLQAASQRKPIFDTLLQVEDYRKASNNLLAAERLLGDRLNAIERGIARIEGELTKLPKLEEDAKALAERIAALVEEEKASREALRQAEEALAAYEEAEGRLREVQNRLDQARERLYTQERLAQEAAHAVAEAEEAGRIVEETRADHEAFLAAEARLGSLEEARRARDALRNQHNALLRQQDQASSDCNRARNRLQEIDEAAAALAALSPAVAEQERLEKALEEAKRRCLAYEQAAKQLAEWEAQAASAQEEAERLAQEAAQAAALAQKIATLQDQARAKREEASQAASRMAVLAEERTRVEKQSEALSEAEEARCPVCESELTPERRDALLLRNAERLKELEQQEAQAHRARREAERAAQEAEAEVARLQKERERLAGEAESERARQRFTDLKARCAQARREREILADAPRVRDALLEQLQALGDPRQKAYLYEAQLRDRPRVEEEIARLEGTLRDLATRLEALEGELAAYGRLDEEMDALRAKRDQHRAGHERYLTHVHTASLLEARRATLEKHQKECEAAQKAVEALAAQVAEAQAAYDAEAHHAARERVLALHKEVSRLATERSEKETLQKNVQQEIQALYARREELVRQQKERARLEELRQTLSWARGLLRTAGPYITRQLVRRISHEASTLYGDIMGDYSGHLEWSEDYELSLEVRGNRRTFRQLSGGEQMCAALAVRLALLREMSHIDIAFFDEPTTNLDADRREGLAERIMQVRGFSQLFVISHDDTFERAAQNFIRIVKDASGSHVEMV